MVKEVAPPKQQLEGERSMQAPQLFEDRLAVYRHCPSSPRGQLLIIHGLGEHMGRLSEVFELFCSLDLDVTGIDLPGHGLSKGPRGHIPSRKRLYDDLDAIRQQAEATTDSSRLPQFVYGHSLGGHLALLYGLRRAPELDGVIASSPLIAATQPPPLWKLMVAHTVGRLLPSLAVDNGLKPDDISSVEDEVLAYTQDPLRHRKISARLGLDSLKDCTYLQEHSKRWKLPLLLMHGKDDQITSCAASEAFAKAAGQTCDWRPWSEARHELHHDRRKQEVFDTMSDWLSERMLANS